MHRLVRNIHTECAFPYSTGCRMRFSVECAFPHLRKRRPASRKSAFWPWALTENRILAVGPHAKAHSGPDGSRKSALWPRRLTQKRTLSPAPHGKAYSGPDGSQKTAFCVRAVTKGRALYPRDGYQKPMQSWLSAARPGKTWRGERPSSCGGATDPPSLPQLPASRFLRLESTRSCAWDWVALSGRFGLVSGEWPSLQ